MTIKHVQLAFDESVTDRKKALVPKRSWNALVLCGLEWFECDMKPLKDREVENPEKKEKKLAKKKKKPSLQEIVCFQNSSENHYEVLEDGAFEPIDYKDIQPAHVFRIVQNETRKVNAYGGFKYFSVNGRDGDGDILALPTTI